MNNATLPYGLELASHGYREAMRRNPHLLAGLNEHEGGITNREVAEALGYPFADPAAEVAGVSPTGR